jgi:hypothetical protein
MMFILFFDIIDTVDLRMSFAVLFVIAFTDDDAVMHEHRSYHGIGRYMAYGQNSQLKTARHESFV